MSRKERLEQALDNLAEQFKHLHWDYPDMGLDYRREQILYWPGNPQEDIMVCVLKDQDFRESLHRHDFYFFNYAYRNDYEAETETANNIITIREGECYMGQPFSGYGLRQKKEDPAVILGVLVQKRMFYRELLPIVAADPVMFRFFLDPQRNRFSEDFLHFPFSKDSPVRDLLEMMVLEYANKTAESQLILKSLASALFLHIARRYRQLHPQNEGKRLSDQLMRYMGEHTDTVSLKELADHFSYHPNYISGALRKETGRCFKQILQEMRMKRAVMLLKGTMLSVEEIADMLGYSDRSNFFKAFRDYYGKTPREYVNEDK